MWETAVQICFFLEKEKKQHDKNVIKDSVGLFRWPLSKQRFPLPLINLPSPIHYFLLTNREVPQTMNLNFKKCGWLPWDSLPELNCVGLQNGEDLEVSISTHRTGPSLNIPPVLV